MMSGICFKITWEEKIQWDIVEIRYTMSFKIFEAELWVKGFIEMFNNTKLWVFLKESKSLFPNAELFPLLH